MKTQQKTRKTWILTAALLGMWSALYGCGVRGGDELSKSEAVQVEAALTSSTTDAQQAANEQVKAFKEALEQQQTIPAGSWVSGTLESFTIQGSVTNPNGGTASVTGTGSYKENKFTLSLVVTFQDWISKGLTLNGAMTVNFTLTADGKVESETTVAGTLKVKGLNARTPNLEVPVVVDIKIATSGLSADTCGTIATIPVGKGACS
ncbi:MAG: hypothetical protein H6728_12200 [Myxococcales bacterium]|nr:hypothetical protein [Myxococcales bacterium]MCB9643827.1 hypothetical protein [Myxococcales bacterium]